MRVHVDITQSRDGGQRRMTRSTRQCCGESEEARGDEPSRVGHLTALRDKYVSTALGALAAAACSHRPWCSPITTSNKDVTYSCFDSATYKTARMPLRRPKSAYGMLGPLRSGSSRERQVMQMVLSRVWYAWSMISPYAVYLSKLNTTR